MSGDGVVNFIQHSGRSYADVEQLIDGIENGTIKRIKFPDGREYDVSKVVLVSKDAQHHQAKPDDIAVLKRRIGNEPECKS